MADTGRVVELTDEDRAAMRAFWAAYDPVYEDVSDELLAAASAMEPFREAAQQPGQEERRAADKERQRRAIMEGEWAAYLDHLHQEGARYAALGVSFGAWFELVSVYRRILVRRMLGQTNGRIADGTHLLVGADRFVDIALSEIGAAYLETKEKIIARQQEAIRELSTPVLLLREGLLVLPLIGMIDTRRARQVTESMLQEIRDQRARLVIIDLTGVPIVDSKVANHLAQSAEAARLMGAGTIFSGISPEIAQTMVTIGASLGHAHTVSDLRAAFEEAERRLARRSLEPS